MTIMTQISEHFDYLMLLFLRVSGLLIGNPIFGRKNVPGMLKIGFCFILTLVFATALPIPESYPVYTHIMGYALTCIRELMFGLAMGFVMTAMFNLVITAGSMMDLQIGFSMVNIYDPQDNTQLPISGSTFNIMLIILFFGMDGHLRLIDILYATISEIPIGSAMIAGDIAWVAAEVMSSSFALSTMMAMPVVAAGLLLEIGLGIIIRTVPQMNMFVVGIPLKIVVGLIVLMGTFAIFVGFSREITDQMFGYIETMFQYFRGGV